MKKLALFLALFFSTNAFAYKDNNTTCANMTPLPTGNLEIDNSENIKLEHQALFFSPLKVTVDYLFKNTSDEDITTTVKFPLPLRAFKCQKESQGQPCPHDFNLQIKVDGNTIQPELGGQVFLYSLSERDNILTHSAGSLNKGQQIDITDDIKRLKVEKGIDFFQTDDALFLVDQIQLLRNDTNKYKICDSNPEVSDETFCFALSFEHKGSYYWQQTFPKGKTVHIRTAYVPFVSDRRTIKAQYNFNTWKQPIDRLDILAMETRVFLTNRTYPNGEYKEFPLYYGVKSLDNYLGQENFQTEEYVPVFERTVFNFTPSQNIDIEMARLGYRPPKINPRRPTGSLSCYDVMSVNETEPILYRIKDINQLNQGSVHAFECTDGDCLLYEQENNPPVCRLSSGKQYTAEAYSGSWAKLYEKHSGYYVKTNIVERPLPDGGMENKFYIFSEKGYASLTQCGDYFKKNSPLQKEINFSATPAYAWLIKDNGEWCELIYSGTRRWTRKENLINLWEK